MQPMSPVCEGYAGDEVVYAKDQPEYNPLPALRFEDGTIVTRWRMSWRERLAAFLRGDVYLSVLTFNKPLQPVRLSISSPVEG